MGSNSLHNIVYISEKKIEKNQYNYYIIKNSCYLVSLSGFLGAIKRGRNVLTRVIVYDVFYRVCSVMVFSWVH